MFDLAAGKLERPLRDKHRGAAMTSIAVHAIVLGTIAGALLVATGAIPEVQRAPMMAFVVSEPPPIPAAPRPAPPAAEKPAAPTRQAPARPMAPPAVGAPAEAAPVVAPTGVAPEKEGAVATGGSGYGAGASGESGIATTGILGGLEGGVSLPPPPPPPPPPPKPVRIGGQIAPPTLITRVEPAYPSFAIAAHVEGIVILEATVDETGIVRSVSVLRGQPVLNDAALDAVKQWRYSPVLVDGRPVPFILTVTVTFRLSHKAS